MELCEYSPEVDLGMKLKGLVDCTDSAKELEEFRVKCKQLEERCKKAEYECIILKLEIQKKNSEAENDGVEECNISIDLEQQVLGLKSKTNSVPGEKDTNEIIGLKDKMDEGEDKVIQLMIENRVLECEKKRAESDVEVWKLKSRELRSRILELETENSILRSELRPLSNTTKSHSINHGEDINIARNSNHALDVATSSECLKADYRSVGGKDVILVSNLIMGLPTSDVNYPCLKDTRAYVSCYIQLFQV